MSSHYRLLNKEFLKLTNISQHQKQAQIIRSNSLQQNQLKDRHIKNGKTCAEAFYEIANQKLADIVKKLDPLNNYSKVQEYSCGKCERTFLSSAGLGGHMSRAHPNSKETPDAKTTKKQRKHKMDKNDDEKPVPKNKKIKSEKVAKNQSLHMDQ